MPYLTFRSTNQIENCFDPLILDVGRNDIHPKVQKLRTMITTTIVTRGDISGIVVHVLCQSLDRLAVGELHPVPIWIAENCEVADGVSCVCRRNGENSQLPPSVGDLVHIFSLLTLEPEVVHT